MPEVRGTAEPYGEPIPPSGPPPPPPPVRPHGTHHYHAAERRAETNRLTLIGSDAAATILTQSEANVVLPTVGPVRPALSSPDELPHARQVIHRQTSNAVLN